MVNSASKLEENSRQIAGIAAKEQTCVPYNRDRNRYRSKLEKKSTPLKKLGKKHSAINKVC